MKLLGAPLYVAWDATYSCNLNCIHCCFGDRNNSISKLAELNNEEAHRLLDELADLKIISMQFAGGEPLVRRDIVDLLTYSATKPYARSIATNGLLITDRMADIMKDTGICSVQISLDGYTAEQHEFIRGAGTFIPTVLAIKRLVARRIPVTVATLVNRRNVSSLSNMVCFLVSLGVKVFRLQFLMPEGNAINIYQKMYLENYELKRAVEEISNHKLVQNGEILLELPCFYSSVFHDSNRVAIQTSSFLINSCGAGTCNLNISACGDVTACGLLTDEKWSCGNIRDHSIKEIWQDERFNIWRTPIQFQDKCKNCDDLYVCHGGCRASAYLINRDFGSADPLCWR